MKSLATDLWIAAMCTALGAFGAAAWLFLDSPIDVVLGVVPDDAFYYLETARNLAATGQSTADQVSNTNGYHPLWMLLMTGLAWIDSSSETLLRAAIGMSFAMHAAVALLLLVTLRRTVGTRWGWTAAACWLVNPLAFLIAQQAVEGAIYALTLVLALGLYVRLGDPARRGPSAGEAGWFGASLGVLCLARTEGIVILPLALGWMALTATRLTGRAAALRMTGVSIAAMAAVATPWLYFSWYQVGTITQDSARMKTLWAADLRRDGTLDWLDGLGATAHFFIARVFTLLTGVDAPTTVPALLCLMLLATAFVVHRRNPAAPQARILRAVASCVAAVGLGYGLTLTDRQVWWLVMPCLSVVLVVVVTAQALCERWRLTDAVQTCVQLTLVVLSVAGFVSLRMPTHALYPWQVDVRSSQVAIEGMVPAGARIGAFNAGIPMYFGSSPVVSIDGLVNHRARVAWTEHRLDAFLREVEVAYIADEQLALSRGLRFVRTAPHLERLAAFPLRWWVTRERVLWRVTWPEKPAR